MDGWTETNKGVELADKKSAVGPASRKCRTGRKQRGSRPSANGASRRSITAKGTEDKSNEEGKKKRSVNRGEVRSEDKIR